jgi:hypothetical protein
MRQSSSDQSGGISRRSVLGAIANTHLPCACQGKASGAVLPEVGVAGAVEGSGKGTPMSDALVEVAEGEEPGIAGELV